ncbi:hypothetical protein L6452_04234 [Arctium lappa]|uniref:Uncharacterized protein n=1 Tax=Arctium lappa TaxID=4217 RepID=A0ACB9FR27_ARCLA|nr:hypothetical protein L6452_04234 [Arctium lappa]
MCNRMSKTQGSYLESFTPGSVSNFIFYRTPLDCSYLESFTRFHLLGCQLKDTNLGLMKNTQRNPKNQVRVVRDFKFKVGFEPRKAWDANENEGFLSHRLNLVSQVVSQ